MVQDAGDLVEQGADILRPDRGLETEQLLDGPHITMLATHHGHIVQTVHVADALVIGLGLCQLLGAAVEQADVRVGALDDLAIHLQHQAQHAMGGRVLGPEVQGVVADFRHRRRPSRRRGLWRSGCRRESPWAPRPGARSRPARRPRVPAPGRSASPHDHKWGSPCGRGARRSRSRSGCAADPGAPEIGCRTGRRPRAQTSWRRARHRPSSPPWVSRRLLGPRHRRAPAADNCERWTAGDRPQQSASDHPPPAPGHGPRHAQSPWTKPRPCPTRPCRRPHSPDHKHQSVVPGTDLCGRAGCGRRGASARTAPPASVRRRPPGSRNPSHPNVWSGWLRGRPTGHRR